MENNVGGRVCLIGTTWVENHLIRTLKNLIISF